MLELVKSGKISPMTKRNTHDAYNREFRKKLRAARIMSGIGPEDIAKQLGVSMDSYVRYESRYMMPMNLIVPFCEITGADITKLMAPPRQNKPRLHSVR